jgi:hypothetical protein
MSPRRALITSGALALSAATITPAIAATPVTGTVSCTLSGSATLKPGLPMDSPGAVTKKPFKTKVSFSGTLSNCTGTQSGTKNGLQIQGGSVQSKGTAVTAVGAPLPSCLGLATPPATPTTLKTTVKFTNSSSGKPKAIAKSTGVATLGTPTVGATVSFATSGPVSKGAFAGQNVSAIAILDLDVQGLLAACNAPGGLTKLSFTGVQGASMLTSP